MMKALLFSAYCLLAVLKVISADDCPHEDKALKKWSELYKDLEADAVVKVTEPVLMNENVDVFGIVIEEGGKLVVDPSVCFIDVYYILVAGEFHVGSEECQFDGHLTITMHGTLKDKYDSPSKMSCKKCIEVIKNGVIEMHGEFKRPWTKLAAPLNKVPEADFLHKEKADKQTQEEENTGAGLLIRTFNSKTGEVKEKTHMNFRHAKFFDENIKKLNAIIDADNDDCVLIAVRKAILKPGQTGGGDIDGLYDVLEKLGHGNITGDLCLREHSFYDAFAMATCKGKKELTTSSCGNYRLGNTFQQVDQCLIHNNKKFCATSFSNSRNHGNSFAVFEVTKITRSVPKIKLAQKPDNWEIGDEVCISSTDYDWKQYECGTIVECSNCKENEIRIDLTVRHDHYGSVTDNVDMRAEVFVNSRNVHLTSEMENFNAEDGGMVKFSEGFKRANIENIEIEKFGDSSQIGLYIRSTAKVIYGREKLRKKEKPGVYPLHYHLCKDVRGKTYLKNNAVHDSWSRCVVTHGTIGAVVDWNTCYVCMGHAFFTEDGGEKETSFTNNFGLGTIKADPKIFTQLDTQPATFFISNPYVTFTGNIGGGGVAHGIFVIFPEEPTGLSKNLSLMAKNEAKRTPMSMENNAVHSYNIGFRFSDRLNKDNKKDMKSFYQPQDKDGKPSKTLISYLTAYKNREKNAFVEGGLIEITQSSFADSPLGLEFRRAFTEKFGNLVLAKSTDEKIREEPGQKPSLTKSVIVGDSDNKGAPAEGDDRSLPNSDKTKERCGMLATSGVWSVDNTWFGGFDKSVEYKTGAICFKNKDQFVVSPHNTFKNVAFGFEDPTNGNRIYNPVSSDDLASASLGNKVAIFHDEEGKVTSVQNSYVLQSTDFVKSEKSEINANWDMTVSKEHFAQLRVNGIKSETVTMMRSDLKRETCPKSVISSFNVITGNQYHYIMKFSKYESGFTIGGIGISSDHSVVIGACIPRDSKPTIQLFFPERVFKPQSASSYDEFFSSDDHLYYFDKDIGVILVKMKSTKQFADNDVDECPEGLCSRVKIFPKGKTKDDLDCFNAYEDKLGFYVRSTAKVIYGRESLERRRNQKTRRKRSVGRSEHANRLYENVPPPGLEYGRNAKLMAMIKVSKTRRKRSERANRLYENRPPTGLEYDRNAKLMAQFKGSKILSRKKRSDSPLPSTDLNKAWGAKAFKLKP